MAYSTISRCCRDINTADTLHQTLPLKCLKLVQLNILAPMWIDDEYKALPCYDTQKYEASHKTNHKAMCLQQSHKLLITLKYLKELDAEIYSLCEVEESQIAAIQQWFPDFTCVFTSHKDGFWSEWLPEGTKWKRNGTCILTKLPVTFSGHIDLGDGCMATLTEIDQVVVIGVHFDTHKRKYTEMETLLDHIQLIKSPIIITGDFNCTDIEQFNNAGYASGIHPDVCNRTTPIKEKGVIDHTLCIGFDKIVSHIDTSSVHSNMSMVDTRETVIEDACNLLSANGSDHYATISMLFMAQ